MHSDSTRRSCEAESTTARTGILRRLTGGPKQPRRRNKWAGGPTRHPVYVGAPMWPCGASASETPSRLIEDAWSIAVDIGDEAGMARAAYLSALLRQRGSGERLFLKARQLYTWALESSLSRGKESDVELFSATLATLLADHGLHDEAEQLLDRHAPNASNLAGQVQHQLHRLYVQFGKIDADTSPQDLERTMAKGRALLVLARNHGQQDQRARVLLHLARLALFQDDLASAEGYRREISDLGKQVATTIPWSLPLLDAELNIARGAPTEAFRSLERLEASALEHNGGQPMDVSVSALYLQALIRARQGRRDEAVTIMHRALQARDALARRRQSLPARDAYLRRRAELHRELLDLLMQAGRAREAFELAQTLRARELQSIQFQVIGVPNEPKLSFGAYADYVRCAGATDRKVDECWQAAQTVPEQLKRLMADDPLPKLPPASPTVDIKDIQTRLRSGDVVLAVSRLKGNRWASFVVGKTSFDAAVSEDQISALRSRFGEPGHVFIAPGESPQAYNTGFDENSEGLEKTVSLLPHAGLVRYRQPQTSDDSWLVVRTPMVISYRSCRMTSSM